ncbi:MAG: sulfatase [Verrucomicrobiota bacterium]
MRSLFFAAIASFAVVSIKADTPKNVLFFLVDDLGIADLSCYGSAYHETPNLDAFAQTAARYTNSYAANPVCSPTRAAIMTGRYPTRVGISDWIPGANPPNPKLITPKIADNLALSEVTIAEHLKANGYQTYFCGKWHLGDKGHFPEDQGFDINIGGHHRGAPPGGYYAPFKNPKLENKPDDHHLTARLTKETINFLNTRNKSKPFFIYHSFYQVHTPTQGDDQFDNYFAEKAKSIENPTATRKEHDGVTRLLQSNHKYAAMVKSMDQAVGQMLDELDRLGLADDTLVIFTSDNGGLSTKPRITSTSNEPYRAGKGWCYEGGIRVPLMIRAPGKTDPGSEINTPAVSMDFFPTILGYLGLDQRPDLHMDGVNLISTIGKPNADRGPIIWHYPHYHGSTWAPGTAIRDGKWKLVQLYHYQSIELYDLSKDPSERNNLAKQRPEKVRELRKLLAQIQKDSKAELPYPNPNYKE